MRPCSREMQGMNSLLNPSSQIPLQDLQNQQIQNSHFDPNLSSNEDFLEQMLSSCSWADPKSPWDLNPPTNLPFPTNNNSSSAKHRDLFNEAPSSNTDNNNVGFRNNFDESVILASKLRQHQISCGNGSAVSDAAKMMLPQQLLMAAARGGLSLNDDIDGSLSQGGDGSMQGLFNGFGAGSMNGTDRASNQSMQHFNHSQGGTMQSPNLGAQGAATTAVMNQPQASGSNGGVPAQPRQRVRARRGQATDPHSIAERLRRERIAERMKSLQELVPNANKTDKASMLDEIIDYVKFLQLQVKVLSMSRLGGAAAVAPLVADMSSEAGGDCIQANDNGGSLARTANGNQTASTNDNSVTVTEHQVAKMMEEDMGTAMQYLQGKGLCLMPISLATAISTATCHNRTSGIINNHAPLRHQSNGEGPTSPSMSVLTVQSMTMGNGGGGGDGTVAKDAASVSKP